MKNHRALTVLLALLALFLLMPPLVLTKVQVNFADRDYTKADDLKILTSRSDTVIPFSGLRTTYGRKDKSRVYFLDPIYRKGSYLRRIDPIDAEYDEHVRIQSIEVSYNGRKGFVLNGEEILSYFTLNDQAEAVENSDGVLELRITGADSQLLPREAFCQRYAAAARQSARLGILFLGIFGAVVYGLVAGYGRLGKSDPEKRWLDAADVCLLLVAVGALTLMTLTSFYGDHKLNPDEWETRDAVRFYEEHTLPPDVRDEAVAPTIGTYGTTRLTEKTPYYLYAGKLARLVSVPNRERFFGLCLGFLLFAFALSKLRSCRWLTAAVFLTPQVWYLYSYGTSDALDYLVSVLVLYQLTFPESMLHRLFAPGQSRKNTGRCLLLGLLFAHVMTAKANYDVILIYAFLMLLVPLLEAEREQRRELSRKYLLLVSVSGAFLAVRLGFDFLHYGLQKSEIMREIMVERAVDSLNPALDQAGWEWYFQMHAQGISFWDFLMNYGLFGSLFRSFTGVYGGMKIQTPGRYYLVMGALYVVLYLVTGYGVRRNGSRTEKRQGLLLHIPALISLLLVFYNGYILDFQPQGRYMLPVLIFMAHGLSLGGKVTEKKWYQLVICATALLGLYSFATGVPQLWAM